MNAVEDLFAVPVGIWDVYFQHPFVCDIQNGTLDKAHFCFYLMQGALYLEEHTKVFTLGAAKVENLSTALFFLEYLSVINRERAAHSGYFGLPLVSEGELKTTARSPDNLSYILYVPCIGYEDGEAEILVAILSCAYSYEVIAKCMLAKSPEAGSNPFYGAWVQEYVLESYAAENAKLIAALSVVTEAVTPAKRQRLRDIFLDCPRYKLKFWEMVWQQKKDQRLCAHTLWQWVNR